MDRTALDKALLKAHETRDLSALVRFYTLAGDQAEAENDTEAACFYLTHAFVFALEIGAQEALELNARLVAKGRAHDLSI